MNDETDLTDEMGLVDETRLAITAQHQDLLRHERTYATIEAQRYGLLERRPEAYYDALVLIATACLNATVLLGATYPGDIRWRERVSYWGARLREAQRGLEKLKEVKP